MYRPDQVEANLRTACCPSGLYFSYIGTIGSTAYNDSNNERILAVNRKMGYKPKPGIFFKSKTLAVMPLRDVDSPAIEKLREYIADQRRK